MLSYFQTRSIKQTTVFRGPLEIGSQLKINVYGYNKVFGIVPLFHLYKLQNQQFVDGFDQNLLCTIFLLMNAN